MDAWRAHGSTIENERRPPPNGRIERTLTVFLAGAECPFTCSFCDLWRYTIDGPTPLGALPAQIAGTLGQLRGARPERIKLYNASNFFDRRAVPIDDLPAIARLCDGFEGVTVESHVSTVGTPALEFARMLGGRLEVAVGLETVHPGAMRTLNKKIDVPAFDRAVGCLRDHDLDVRAFVLLGAPHVSAEECVEWTTRTVQHAVRAGARTVAIIPVRGGNGEMERLLSAGDFVPPTFEQLEAALDESVGTANAVITVDLWDVERLPTCAQCGPERVARLGRMNLSQQREPRIRCARHVA